KVGGKLWQCDVGDVHKLRRQSTTGRAEQGRRRRGSRSDHHRQGPLRTHALQLSARCKVSEVAPGDWRDVAWRDGGFAPDLGITRVVASRIDDGIASEDSSALRATAVSE